jgi:subtilisin family serine protease
LKEEFTLPCPQEGFTESCDGLDDIEKAFAQHVATLRSAGTATVIATGNDGLDDGVGIPSCQSRAISVGNTTLAPNCPFGQEFGLSCPEGTPLEDMVHVSSNSASFAPVLLAPGTHICSSVAAGYAVPANAQCKNGDGSVAAGVAAWTGTSMAAPLVAGAFAVLKQFASERNKGASVNALFTDLASSGVNVTAKGVTRPRVDVWAALNWAHCGRAAC